MIKHEKKSHDFHEQIFPENKKNPQINLTQENPRSFQASDPLLLLESQQIVHHMLLIKDWTILSIYTPSIQQTQNNFLKKKKAKIAEFQEIAEAQSSKKLLSVLAIRTQQKQSTGHTQKQYDQLSQLKQDNHDERRQLRQRKKLNANVEQIKMLHKQCQLQNMQEWILPSASQIRRSRNDYLHITQKPDHFILLVHNRIQLYVLEYSHKSPNVTSIQLSRIYEMNYLLPYKVIWLRNEKKEQITKLKKQKNEKNHRIKADILFDHNQGFSIAIVGIDRSKSFWSTQYQIQPQKRSVYLFKNFVITDKIKISTKIPSDKTNLVNKYKKSNEQDTTPVKNDGRGQKQDLRRVRSVENIINFGSKGTFLDQSKKKLSQSQCILKQNIETTQNFYKRSFQPSHQALKQPLRTSKRSQFEQQNIKASDLQRQRIQAKNLVPKTLLYDQSIQLFPILFQSGQKKNTFASKNKVNIPLELVQHFYVQRLGLYKKTYNELMLLVMYQNYIVLVNANRRNVVSKVLLQQGRNIRSLLQIRSLFGIYSVLIIVETTNELQRTRQKLIRHSNNGQADQKPFNSATKIIKVSIDMINHKKLGIGMEPMTIPGLFEQQKVIQITSLWKPSLIQDINNLIQFQDYLENQLKQSYYDVEDLIARSQNQQQGQKTRNNTFSRNQSNNNTQQCSKIGNKTQKVDQYANLYSFMGMPLNQMQFNVLLLTSQSRLLLYNHLSNKFRQIYPMISHMLKEEQILGQKSCQNKPISSINMCKISNECIGLKCSQGPDIRFGLSLKIKVINQFCLPVRQEPYHIRQNRFQIAQKQNKFERQQQSLLRQKEEVILKQLIAIEYSE